MNKAVFFDRDGVINQAILTNDGIRAPWLFEEFVFSDHIKEIVVELKNHKFKTIVFTNQPDVPRGFVARETVEMMNGLISRELKLDDIFVCYHDNDDNCLCRKPKAGMLIDAAKRHDVDLSESFVIGDTWKDVEAGRAAGCRTILLNKNYNKGTTADYIVGDLNEAAKVIIGD